jgi:hypothetical protein
MKIYILLGENNVVRGWADRRSMESEIEVEIDESDPFFSAIPNIHVYQDGKIIADSSLKLERLKTSKLNELNEACNRAILGRFSYEINGESFLFSNDLEAQSNFDKADRAFDKQMMSTIPWTAYNSLGDVVRLDFTAETFPPLYMAHLNHIQGNISRFRDELMPLVESATTIEEVENINW